MQNAITIGRFILFPRRLNLSEALSKELSLDFEKSDRFLLNVLFVHWLVAAIIFPLVFSNFLLGFVGGGILCLASLLVYKHVKGTLLSRAVISLSLVCFTFIFIQQSFGKIETHFHFWIVLGLLLSYKDCTPLVWVSLVIIIHHVVFNYCQNVGIQAFGNEMVVYETGASWFVTLLHAFFVIPSAVLFARIATINLKGYLELESQYLILDKLNGEKSISIQTKNSELERKNKELTQYSFMLTHDLKAPLVVVQGLTEAIKRRYYVDMAQPVKDCFNHINSSVNRMDAIINDIMNYMGVDCEKQKESNFTLGEIVSEIRDSSIDPERKDFLKLNDDVQLKGYRSHFLQILENLIGNSFKYNDQETPAVKINVGIKTNHTVISVIDNGPGIEHKFHANLFDMFNTGAAKPSESSTGVGLAIVKKLVVFNGGEVWLESNLSEGASFHFTWPNNRAA